MSHHVTIMDAVGLHVQLTLTNGAVHDGVIYTYNPDQKVIVLVTNANHHKSGKDPTFKIIRLPFVKSMSISQNYPVADQLPNGIEMHATLPSMKNQNEAFDKKFHSLLKLSEANRQKLLKDVSSDTPIGALDTIENLARIYPTVAWDPINKAVTIDHDKQVVVVGDPDWGSPVVRSIDGADSNCVDLVQRVDKALLKN